MITFSGVLVSGDLIKIGQDFNVDEIISVCQKDWRNVINLGVFARERDTVQSGVVGLAELSRLVLKVKLKKDNKIQLLEWAANKLNHKQ